jgi:hypothetical protein
MITDDLDTPGPGYWEINLAGITEKSQSERRHEAPRADINSCVGKRIQTGFEIPWVNAGKTGESFQARVGSSNFGVKWRFLGQEGQRIAGSICRSTVLHVALRRKQVKAMISQWILEQRRSVVV